MTSNREEFPSILALLHVPYQAIIKQVQHDLTTNGYTDLGAAHFNVLPHLPAGGTRLVHLAEAAQISKQSMNYLVDHLEAQGYVERLPDPLDGRAKIIRLTERGRELSRATRQSLRKIQARSARHLGEADMRRLRELLLRLVTAQRG